MGTLGELVKKWRTEAGLSQPEMARRIGHGVKYQNLQQLESGKAEQPKYIAHLAYFMRSTVDDLLALRMPPPYDPKAAPGPAREAAAPAAPAAPRVAPELMLSDLSPLAALLAEQFDRIDDADQRQRVFALFSQVIQIARYPGAVPATPDPGASPIHTPAPKQKLPLHR